MRTALFSHALAFGVPLQVKGKILLDLGKGLDFVEPGSTKSMHELIGFQDRGERLLAASEADSELRRSESRCRLRLFALSGIHLTQSYKIPENLVGARFSLAPFFYVNKRKVRWGRPQFEMSKLLSNDARAYWAMYLDERGNIAPAKNAFIPASYDAKFTI